MVPSVRSTGGWRVEVATHPLRSGWRLLSACSRRRCRRNLAAWAKQRLHRASPCCRLALYLPDGRGDRDHPAGDGEADRDPGGGEESGGQRAKPAARETQPIHGAELDIPPCGEVQQRRLLGVPGQVPAVDDHVHQGRWLLAEVVVCVAQ